MLGTAVEKSLPLSMPSTFIDVSNMLMSYPETLPHLNVHRTTSSYKIVEGLGRTYKERIIMMCKKRPFSLQADESVSKAHEKVFTILVSFVDEETKQCVIHHFASLEVSFTDNIAIIIIKKN